MMGVSRLRNIFLGSFIKFGGDKSDDTMLRHSGSFLVLQSLYVPPAIDKGYIRFVSWHKFALLV
jgi:hypothetical protein